MGTAWNKLKTVMRGQARVSMERLVDANDMLLLDQQLYETEHALRDARRQLARLKAEQKRNRERSEQLTRQQEHYEAGARQAMAHEEEGLALDIGQRLAELEAQQARLEQQGVSLGQQENEFQRFIQQAAEQLRSLRHEQSMARTQEALFGQAEVRQQQGRGLAQRLTDSQQTLLQIQQRQEECRWLWQSEIHCRDQPGSFPGDSLDQRMAEAGIGDSRSERAKEILQRLSRE
ncbi:PspA/IM30 family protein [Alcanivorax sp.]|uniref:PspA/IM30 family protein n=1 Tax=Alcanivorax sp. TaxID=1872427 RepID=UPI0025B8A0CF|nr:PspA/IM30 family protein [Alcanivorax sp.]